MHKSLAHLGSKLFSWHSVNVAALLVGLYGTIVIGEAFPGRPRTPLAFLGPYVLLLLAFLGLLGLAIEGVVALIRRYRQRSAR